MRLVGHAGSLAMGMDTSGVQRSTGRRRSFHHDDDMARVRRVCSPAAWFTYAVQRGIVAFCVIN